MRFWDSSALVPLMVRQAATTRVTALMRKDPEVLAWWGTRLECASAIARLERQGQLRPPAVVTAFQRLDAVVEGWHEVQPTDPVRETGRRLLRTHDLRAADALQLAAAVHAAEGSPTTLPFVCLDARLADAALREGFRVVGV
ncbi:MAG: hypothetical protein A2138_18280 [Deltaproteobacteria bacterium RBG_16_71_12]|nr:MAG: hypothetical protein A2138_18280 [Deltaproteobacteria bacterium RBG_16_71_12]